MTETPTGYGGRAHKFVSKAVVAAFFLLPVQPNLGEVACFLALMTWIISGGARGSARRFFTGPSLWWALPALFMFLIPLVALSYTSDMALGFKYSIKSYFWLFPFMVATVVADTARRDKCVLAFVLGLSLVSIASMLQYSGILPLHSGATATGFVHRAPMSVYYVLGLLILSFVFRMDEWKARRPAMGVLALLFVIGLVLSTGRPGYIAFVLTSPLMLLNVLGRKRLLAVAVACLVIVAVLAMTPPVQQRVGAAIDDIRQYKGVNVETSVGLRFYMWKGAVRIIAGNPVLGTGTGGYRNAMKELMDASEIPRVGASSMKVLTTPHNGFLHMAVSYGPVGLLAFLYLLYMHFRGAWAVRHTLWGFSALGYGLMFFVVSLTGGGTLLSASALLALFYGFTYVEGRETSEAPSEVQ